MLLFVLFIGVYFTGLFFIIPNNGAIVGAVDVVISIVPICFPTVRFRGSFAIYLHVFTVVNDARTNVDYVCGEDQIF